MSEWDAAASDYETKYEKTTGYMVDRILDWIKPTPGMRVADVAAGPGVVTSALAFRGARVSASDFSPAMIERLRARAAEEGIVDLVDSDVADAEALTLDDDAVDAACSNFGVIFAPDVNRALRELARVTRAGGKLAISAWTTESANGWTTLLPTDYADELGFRVAPRPMYRWSSAGGLRSACEEAGWANVVVETIDFPPTVHLSADHMAEALDTPATRLALAALTSNEVERLEQYLIQRARRVFGDSQVALPRQAWLARGRGA